ncbi:GNAT family N-acetyltransferase [Virgibacillus senegalensis]|uniref:GNAT family N-acetyltransferase n=1 Tax=Virgibacillus senegalensis TaxID=1499679 RepID=UPI00069CFC0A|nr:GNAT family N-acetyltransferase [Virgibacillus senegalensis]
MGNVITDDESLFNQVKCLQGDDYLTIEETGNLTEEQMKRIVKILSDHPEYRKIPVVTILTEGNLSADLGRCMRDGGFQLQDEVIMYYRSLDDLPDIPSAFAIKSLHKMKKEEFQIIWKQAMHGSLNASSNFSTDKHMNSVRAELGCSYQDSCLVAFEGKEPIGVLMPHIEPGTEKEGRLFYFGLLPAHRNKGKSRKVHMQALAILKHEFHAEEYIGSTSVNNIPMRKILKRNGCQRFRQNKVFRRIVNE